MEQVDWISNLPDPILTHILSFMSTKEAVRTSLLAKRYQKLWVSVPVLDFDLNDFLPSDEEGEEGGEYKKFVKFIDGVFENRKTLTLESFKIACPCSFRATEWIDTAAKLKPKFLSAKLANSEYCDNIVPDSVFICESLQELVLSFKYPDMILHCQEIDPRSVNLPCLKKITLGCLEIEDEVMKNLLSGMPALEEMMLNECNLDSCCISSSTLKCLVLHHCHNGTILCSPDILISIPSLAFLKVYGWAKRLKFENLKSHVEAVIHIVDLLAGDDGDDGDEPLFLMGLSNVTSLELVMCEDMEVAVKKEKEKNGFPAFPNLKTLIIGGWDMIDNFDLVLDFLLHAPNLKNLTLLHQEEPGQPGIEISLKLGNYLEILEIMCYKKNDESASNLVKSVLARFQTLIKGRQ